MKFEVEMFETDEFGFDPLVGGKKMIKESDSLDSLIHSLTKGEKWERTVCPYTGQTVLKRDHHDKADFIFAYYIK